MVAGSWRGGLAHADGCPKVLRTFCNGPSQVGGDIPDDVAEAGCGCRLRHLLFEGPCDAVRAIAEVPDRRRPNSPREQ